MTKAELLDALTPFADEITIDVRIGTVTKPLARVSYEYVAGFGQLALVASEPMRRRRRKAAAQAAEADHEHQAV